MRTVVGAMSGYCEIDSVKIASKPASMIVIAMTQAKIGRRMKNLAIGLLFLCGSDHGSSRLLRGGLLRFTGCGLVSGHNDALVIDLHRHGFDGHACRDRL